MKRSEVNELIREAYALLDAYRIQLPPFFHWSPEDWSKMRSEAKEIVDNELGWDITDFGSGAFEDVGLVLMTLRNGNYHRSSEYPKSYAEKLLISRENQHCPMHFHKSKMEDIINRNGGNLMIKVYNATADGGLADSEVRVTLDGIVRALPAGSVLRIKPGESITVTRGLYHEFWAEEGHGPVIVGEVSKCNDDHSDNYFLEPRGRFPALDEDEAPFRLLCTEYPKG